MADDKREAVLNRIRHMMTRAGDPRTPEHEAQNAANMVSRMIAQYQIEDAELRATKKEGPSEIVRFQFEVSNKYGLGKERGTALHWGVIAPLGGTSYKTSYTSTAQPTRMTVFLPADLMDFAKVLMSSLHLQMEHGMQVKVKAERSRLEGESYLGYSTKDVNRLIGTFRKAYVLGFGTAIGERIKAGRQEAVQEAVQEAQAEAYAHGADGEELAKVGSAIALVDTSQRADQAMNDFYEETYGEGKKLGASRRVKISNGRGYHAGKDDAKDADIGNKRIGGSRAQLH